MTCEQFSLLDYRIGIKAIKKELEDEQESLMWEVWLSLYPNMTEESFISFEEFKAKSNRTYNEELESRKAIDNLVKERRSV